MKRISKITLLVIVAVVMAVAGRMLLRHKGPQLTVPEGFQEEVMLSMTPVKDQGKSELCWVFAMLATVETEHLMRGDSVNISTDFLARKYLEEQAIERFRSHGEQRISLRGMAPMALTLLRRYGAIPYDAYNTSEPINYNVLSRRVEKAVDLAIAQRKDEKGCREAVVQLLDENIGYLPMFCFMYGCQYTFLEFAHSVCEKDEYQSLTSLKDFPYGETVVLPFKDNHYGCKALNVEPERLVECIEESLRHGHPVMWEGGRNDDHAVCIIGMGKDKDGKEYFVAKNSWGEDNATRGMMYIDKKYISLHTAVETLSAP